MFGCLVFLLICQQAIGKPSLKPIIEPNKSYTSGLLVNFFKNHPTLRVFNFGQTPLSSPISAIWSQAQHDLDVLDDMGIDAVDPSINIGYVVHSNRRFLEDNLPNFARINTNGRWLLLIDDSIDSQQATDFLTSAWTAYNMLNILLVQQTTGYYYNPFIPEILELDCSKDFVDFTTFDERTRNARGFPLKVEAITKRQGYFLEEIHHVYDNLMDYVMRSINARPVEVVNLPVMPQIGVKSELGHFVGSHKRVNDSAIELSLVSHVMIDLGKSNVAYLTSTRRIEYYYVVKNRPMKAQIIDLLVLDPLSKTVECVCLCLALLVWFSMEQFRLDNVRHRHGFTRVLTDFISIMWGSGISLVNRNKFSIRIIVSLLLFYALIMNNTYQGRIITKLSLPRDTENINSLAELLATNYTLYSAFSNWNFEDSEATTLYQLARRNVKASDKADISQMIINQSDVAILGTLRAINYHQANIYDPKTGAFIVHRIPTRVIDYLGSFLVRRNSAFLGEFNRALVNAFETGLQIYADKQFKQKLSILKIQKLLKRIDGERQQRGPKPIRIANLELVFTLYFRLTCVAVAIFLVEVTWFRAKRTLYQVRFGRLRNIVNFMDRIERIF